MVGGWRGHGGAAPAHLALSPPLLRQDSELRPPSLQGQAVMACGDTPPDVTTTALLSSSPSSSFQCPQTPISPNKHPCTTPGSAQYPQSPLAHFSHCRLFIAPQCPSPAQYAHHSKYFHPPNLHFPSQIHLPSFHSTRDPLSLYHTPTSTISPLHPNTLCHPNTPYPFQASPGDTPFVIVGPPIYGRSQGVAGAHSRHSWRRRRQSWALSGVQVCKAPSGGHRRW